MNDDKLRPYDPDVAALEAAASQFEEMGLDYFDPDEPRGLQGLGEAAKSLAGGSSRAGRFLLTAAAPVAMAIDKGAAAGDWLGEQTLSEEERQFRKDTRRI
ncbi:MAG: hypothetical protein QM769_02135 [Pseudoxanthomonas sp.]